MKEPCFTFPKIEILQTLNSYLWFADKEFLQYEYIENETSAQQIAREIGCSHSTILKYLKQFQIPIRRVTPDHYKRGQTPFGRKLVGGREVIHKREQEIIEKIKDLRAQGFSYWKIAEIFNAMGIPTKSKKARWQATTVMKIYKRSQ